MNSRIRLLFLLLLCLVHYTNANQVPLIKAQIIANNFQKTLSPNNQIQYSLAYVETSKTNDTLFYVFNSLNNHGFVIISAEDATEPIIAYSDEGSFVSPQKGNNIDFWINAKKTEISQVRLKKQNASSEIQYKWNCYLNGITPVTSTYKKVNSQFPSNTFHLVQTTWNQSPYYNNMCPGGSVTGCVATAMSQIMRYWSYPSIGNGKHCYSGTYGTLCEQFDTVNYHWNNMPMSLGSTTPTSQINEVAKLMYDAGVSVNMQYSPMGSGAWVISADDDSVCAQIAYWKYFKYDSTSVQGFLQSNFAIADWTNMLKNELNNSRPVEYAGWDPLAGGHTWVCDGYNSLNQFHMNWGWGGQDNGWYALTNLDPQPYDFTVKFEAVIGIQPASPSCNLKANCIYSIGNNGEVSFTNTSSGVTSGTQYTWYPGDGSVASSGSSYTHTYNYNGKYYIYLNAYNSSGCSSWKLDSVTITNATPCALQAIFTYNIGSNGSVSFSDASTGELKGATYSWNAGDGSSTSSTSSTFTHTYQYNGYYLVSLTVQNPGYGCSSTYSNYLYITSAPPCTLNTSFTYTKGNNGSVSFTSTSTGVKAGTKYYWYPGDNTFVIGGPTLIHKYTYNQHYLPELFLVDSGYNACEAFYSDTLTVTDALPCNLKADFNYSTGLNGKVTFTSNSLNVGPGANYYWYFGDNTNATTTTPAFTHYYTYNGNYYVQFEVVDTGFGCASSKDTEIIINTGINCNVKAEYKCTTGANGLVTLTSTSTGVLPGASLTWRFPDGTTASGSTCNHTFLYNGTYNISLDVFDTGGFGCEQYFDSTIIVTNARQCNLQPYLTTKNGANGEVTFINSGTTNYSGTTYSWYFGDGSPNLTTSVDSCTHTYLYNGSYSVSLFIQDSGWGCSTQTYSYIAINNARICNIIPSFTISEGPNGHVTVKSTSTGTYSNTTYNWNFGDGTLGTGDSCIHNYINNGIYDISLYIADSGYGCNRYVDSNVNISTAPGSSCSFKPYFSYTRNYGRSINFFNQTAGIGSNPYLNWNFGDGTGFAYTSNCTHSYSSDGNYLVTLSIDYNGCSSSISQYINVYFDTVVMFGQSNTLMIYPNPTSNQFVVYIPEIPNTDNASIELDNILGQEIFKWQYAVTNNELKVPLTIGDAKGGIYFIKVIASGETYIGKLSIVR